MYFSICATIMNRRLAEVRSARIEAKLIVIGFTSRSSLATEAR